MQSPQNSKGQEHDRKLVSSVEDEWKHCQSAIHFIACTYNYGYSRIRKVPPKFGVYMWATATAV